MNLHLKKAGASTVGAEIERADAGGFIAVASNGDLDRDGERIQPGCFLDENGKLPATIKVHLDHSMSARDVVAVARPYYKGDLLMIDATFDRGKDAQEVRRKVQDGTLDSLSIVFMGKKWETIDGVRTCVKGTLLAADVVSIPSNPGARILSMRGFSNASAADLAREVAADAILALARIEIAECKRIGYGGDGPQRRRAAAMVRAALTEVDRRPRPGLHTPQPKETK